MHGPNTLTFAGNILMANVGKATIRRGKIYFDEAGWAIVRAAAKKAHKSPKQIVMVALKRGVKLYGKV